LREQKKVAARRGIRDAAMALFEKQGFEATTVDQIADAAGVSRATIFNYFPSKEAVVFEQDPSAREGWQALMEARPLDEPLWTSLSIVLFGFAESLRERMPLQRRLKAQSPALAQSTQNFGDQFRADLTAWVASRSAERGDDELDVALQVNLAMAALGTAYQTWPADEPFDGFMQRVEQCLTRARPHTRKPGAARDSATPSPNPVQA
jgi:AcrR family transcriptional regulator